MRGEKLLRRDSRDAFKGSSPRVRGKAAGRPGATERRGITPACAGKSGQLIFSRPCKKDHPRVCGEKAALANLGAQPGGSPPRVRGKVQADRDAIPEPGITPACAGKSARGGCSASCPWDHPRVCGEKAAGDDIICLRPGSPPRVRGKAGVVSKPNLVFGITPACAGKSSGRQRRNSGAWDHPRVCGEKTREFL